MERGLMKTFSKMLIAGSLLTAAAGLVALPQFAASPDEPTPAFHAEAPKDALPPTMEASIFTDIQTFNAYVIAGDYSFNHHQFNKALHFYQIALTKVIATKQEESSVKQKITKCNKKLGV